MTDEEVLAESSAFSLSSPGVVTTYESGPFALVQTYGFYVGAEGALHTVEYAEGGPEVGGMQALTPVAWEIKVPAGGRLFSMTSGVSPARAQQFWVGWLRGEQVWMEALAGEHPLASPLVPNETVIFPAVADSSGAGYVYSWKPVASGATLWQRKFSRTTVSAAAVADVPGRPLLSAAAAIPGERSPHAVLGWVEQDGKGSVLGLAIVRAGKTTVMRSPTIPMTTPLAQQRLGVWATSFERFELTAIVANQGASKEYELARFWFDHSAPKGSVERRKLDLHGTGLVSGAIDYYRDNSQARPNCVFLAEDGRLLGGDEDLRVVRASVPRDSVLPVVTSSRRAYWGSRGSDGRLAFKPF